MQVLEVHGPTIVLSCPGESAWNLLVFLLAYVTRFIQGIVCPCVHDLLTSGVRQSSYIGGKPTAYRCYHTGLYKQTDEKQRSVPINVFFPSRHVDAAMETVEVATKELKVETRLHNIENRWKEEQLGFVRHRDTEVKQRCRKCV